MYHNVAIGLLAMHRTQESARYHICNLEWLWSDNSEPHTPAATWTQPASTFYFIHDLAYSEAVSASAGHQKASMRRLPHLLLAQVPQQRGLRGEVGVHLGGAVT